jgi:hypothetical protein
LSVISGSALAITVASSYAGVFPNPKLVLNCSTMSEKSSTDIFVYQTGQNTYQYYAAICAPDPQGSAYDTGPCETSRGPIDKQEGDELQFQNYGVSIDIVDSCAGERVRFSDRNTHMAITIPLLSCTPTQ